RYAAEASSAHDRNMSVYRAISQASNESIRARPWSCPPAEVAGQVKRGQSVSKSDQGITRTGRGEEQPTDKDRAQKVHRSRSGETSPSQEETRKETGEKPARSGRS